MMEVTEYLKKNMTVRLILACEKETIYMTKQLTNILHKYVTEKLIH